MGNKFFALWKSEVAKIAPNGAALMGKLNQDMANMKAVFRGKNLYVGEIMFGKG